MGSVQFGLAPMRAMGAAVPKAGLQTAPAVAPEEADGSQAWKYRLEFKELNLQLIGVATLQDQASCFIKSPGSSEQMIYAIGDVIGGYRVTAIDAQSVSFERGGARFQLALSSTPGSEGTEPAASPAASFAAHGQVVSIKTADAKLKTRTQKYATAKLIEDASDARKSGMGSGAEDGVSLPHGVFSNDFMIPVGGELSSGFGYRRHPMGGGIRFHRGVDLAGPNGTPIKAAAAGRVVLVFNSVAHDLGRHIVIKHNDEYETLYGHLSRVGVTLGQWVEKGEVIGKEGSTGNSTGPHLHFEIHRNKEAVNPLPYLHMKE